MQSRSSYVTLLYDVSGMKTDCIIIDMGNIHRNTRNIIFYTCAVWYLQCD
jgi:hypothetical protein